MQSFGINASAADDVIQMVSRAEQRTDTIILNIAINGERIYPRRFPAHNCIKKELNDPDIILSAA